jgi:hypothetical protein
MPLFWLRVCLGAAYAACMVVVTLTAQSTLGRIVGEIGIGVGALVIGVATWHRHRARHQEKRSRSAK